MIGIVDYGVGNLFSLMSSLKHMGINSTLVKDEEALQGFSKIILPGVGAFGDASKKLIKSGMVPALNKKVEQGTPLLGICVGMQLLFEKSYEYGVHQGLGYIKGEIYPLINDIPKELKIPQTGWNSLTLIKENDPILKYTKSKDYVYFVHSYYAKENEDCVAAYTSYGVNIPAVVRKANVMGVQFHPEKSGEAGLRLLKAFSEI